MTIRYVPLVGTNGAGRSPWAEDPDSPFQTLLRAHGFYALRGFQWSGEFDGLWWSRLTVWREEAERLGHFLARLPLEDRNIIASSHGGQLAIFLAASGVQLASLTTVGTPRHRRVPAEQALPNILFWQHIYDSGRDWIATLRPRNLGQLGDWAFSFDRRFLLPGVQNHGERGIGHSGVLKDTALMPLWVDRGWLALIRLHVERIV